MRNLIILLIGLVVGAMLTVVALDALRKDTAYPRGVMAVKAAQVSALEAQLEANACTADSLLPHLQTLAALGNDLEPAFLPSADDVLFSQHAADYRAAADTALVAAPADCSAAAEVVESIKASCKACHQDFKS